MLVLVAVLMGSAFQVSCMHAIMEGNPCIACQSSVPDSILHACATVCHADGWDFFANDASVYDGTADSHGT
jgi:hypothetical protein